MDNFNKFRPGTVESAGRRIYERQFYVTQNESKFQMSAKVFTNIHQSSDKESKAVKHRPPLNGYRREFSMPDHFHVEVPEVHLGKHKRTRTLENMEAKAGADDEVRQESPRLKNNSAAIADSLLSKHNGWITIDGENMNRKQAPETF